MRILSIPVLEPRGMDSLLSPHYGRSPFHLILDAEGREIVLLDQSANRPGEGSFPLTVMMDFGVSLVICPGLGRGANAHLEGAGIEVLVTAAATVREALKDWRAGRLRLVTEALLLAHDKEQSRGKGYGHGFGAGEGCGKEGSTAC